MSKKWWQISFTSNNSNLLSHLVDLGICIVWYAFNGDTKHKVYAAFQCLHIKFRIKIVETIVRTTFSKNSRKNLGECLNFSFADFSVNSARFDRPSVTTTPTLRTPLFMDGTSSLLNLSSAKCVYVPSLFSCGSFLTAWAEELQLP